MNEVLGAIIGVIIVYGCLMLLPYIKEKPDYKTRVYSAKLDNGLTTAEKINRKWHKDKFKKPQRN
jgi:hypothetical protein